MTSGSETAFYDRPALYDALHDHETPSEAAVIQAVIARHGNGGRDWLEPACGTGRYLRFFADLGYRTTGYDLNPRALAYARRRLRGVTGRVVRAGMAEFSARGVFDAAFCLIGSFRHLLSEAAALRHLRRTAAALRPGGVYVVGFDLADYKAKHPDEEGWEVERRGRRLRHLLMTLPPDPRTRRERVMNFVTVATPRGDKVLESTYDLRCYDARQWKALVGRSPFRLEATYCQEGPRIRLSAKTRYALFVLKKKRTGAG